jgi:hypothetical protein
MLALGGLEMALAACCAGFQQFLSEAAHRAQKHVEIAYRRAMIGECDTDLLSAVAPSS